MRKRTRVLRGGVKRIIHVVAKALQHNNATGENTPVIGIRLASRPEKMVVVRHVEILGPSTLRHTPKHPLPNTDGRAVCVLRTSAPLRVHGWPKKKRSRRRQILQAA